MKIPLPTPELMANEGGILALIVLILAALVVMLVGSQYKTFRETFREQIAAHERMNEKFAVQLEGVAANNKEVAARIAASVDSSAAAVVAELKLLSSRVAEVHSKMPGDDLMADVRSALRTPRA